MCVALVSPSSLYPILFKEEEAFANYCQLMRIVMAEPPTAEKGKSFNNETLLIGENARLVNQTMDF